MCRKGGEGKGARKGESDLKADLDLHVSESG